MHVPERVVLGMVERGKLSWGEDGIPTDEILFQIWGGESGASLSPLAPYLLEQFARGHLRVPRLGPDDRPVEMNEVFAAHCSGRRITRVLVTE